MWMIHTVWPEETSAVGVDTSKRETSKRDNEIHSECGFTSLRATEIEYWLTVLLSTG